METMNHEHYVSLEVAKQLKEAGFDWQCKALYKQNGDFILRGYDRDWNSTASVNPNVEYYSAPTLNVTQKWMREVEGIFVCVIPEIKDYHATWIFYICDAQCMLYEDDDCFLTYEEDLEEGIKKTLEILKK